MSQDGSPSALRSLFLPVPEQDKKRMAFVDIGRTIGAALIFVLHLTDLFVKEYLGSTGFSNTIAEFASVPLGLPREGGIGIAAVYFFFLVSGFVTAALALRRGAARFGVNRLMRLYPVMAVAVGISSVAILLGLRPLISGEQPDIDLGTILANITVINFYQQPLSALVGVAWTLAVELVYVGLLILVLPLMRKWIWLAIAVELEVVLILILLRGQFGEGYGVFAAQSAFLLLLLMGQVLWAGWYRKIPGWLAGVYLVAAWLMFVWAAGRNLSEDYDLMPTPLAFAVLLFIVGLGLEHRIRYRPIWEILSERSYSLYLLHGVVAFPIMHAMVGDAPLWLTLVTGIVATIVLVELCYRLVERPCHNLARRMTRAKVPAKAAAPEGSKDATVILPAVRPKGHRADAERPPGGPSDGRGRAGQERPKPQPGSRRDGATEPQPEKA